MAEPRSRRHHQRCSAEQVPRMYVCWILLISLAVVLGDSRQLKATYIRGEKTLRLECPQEAPDLLATYLERLVESGKGSLPLAEWLADGPENKRSQSKHDRVKVDNSYKERLVAELTHVTCYDSGTYVCINSADWGKITVLKYNYTFRYTDDITLPQITESPLRPRHEVGSVLRLNCSASIGAADNGLLWEVRRPQDPNFTVVSPQTFPYAIIGDQVIEQRSDCNVHATRQLQFRLAQVDDGTLFQCRMSISGNFSRTTVALECPDDGSAPPGAANRTTACRCQKTRSAPGTDVAKRNKEMSVTSLGTGGSNTNTPRAEQLKEDEGREADSQSDPTLVIVIVVLVAVVAVVLLGMALAVRRWRKQPMQPLVVMDTPTSSEYGGYVDRHLPNLASLNMLNHHRHNHHPSHPQASSHSHTMPASLSSTSRYVESPMPSTLANTQDDPNVSIYVSMTGLDNLKDSLPHGKGLDVEGMGPKSYADAPRSMGSEYDSDLGPAMRQDGNESVYSNQGLNTRLGINNNASPPREVDNEVTRLKIVD